MPAPAVVAGLFALGERLIDKYFPDPQKKQEALLELQRMERDGELAELTSATELAKGQLAINQEEAKHASVFVAGWRPALGWVCVTTVGCYYIPRALVSVGVWLWQVSVFLGTAGNAAGPLPAYPEMGIADLIGLLLTMLGAVGVRTKETLAGVARERL